MPRDWSRARSKGFHVYQATSWNQVYMHVGHAYESSTNLLEHWTSLNISSGGAARQTRIFFSGSTESPPDLRSISAHDVAPAEVVH